METSENRADQDVIIKMLALAGLSTELADSCRLAVEAQHVTVTLPAVREVIEMLDHIRSINPKAYSFRNQFGLFFEVKSGAGAPAIEMTPRLWDQIERRAEREKAKPVPNSDEAAPWDQPRHYPSPIMIQMLKEFCRDNGIGPKGYGLTT